MVAKKGQMVAKKGLPNVYISPWKIQTELMRNYVKQKQTQTLRINLRKRKRKLLDFGFNLLTLVFTGCILNFSLGGGGGKKKKKKK